MSLLPELVVFSVRDSNNEVRYLSFTGPQRQLRCGTEEGIFSDIIKFVVESAGDGLVHIRSSYENNYWARASRFEPWLLASAPEKVEDMSKDECTLFRPRMSAGNVFVGFVHVQSGMNVVMRPPTDAHAYNLCVEQAAPTDFSYIDFAPLSRTKLPRYVMFLGDNNTYLSIRKVTETYGILTFYPFDRPMTREVGFEVFYTASGDNFRIKSMSMNEFCCVRPPRRTVIILIPVPESDPDQLFDATLSSPPNTSLEGISLRSLANHIPMSPYCHRTLFGMTQDLAAASNTPHVFNACLQLRHLAISGQSRVNIESFRNAWTGPKSFRVLREIHVFNSHFHEDEVIVNTEYLSSLKRTFNNSTPLIKGPTAVFNGGIPNVVSTGELELPDEATDVTATWGETYSVVLNKKEDVVLKMPPRSIITSTLSVNIAIYEVPFSYKQIDELPFGGTATQHLHDGVFKIESEYGASFTHHDVRPFTAEVLDENIYKDLRVLEIEGINAVDDGIEPKASDEVNQE